LVKWKFPHNLPVCVNNSTADCVFIMHLHSLISNEKYWLEQMCSLKRGTTLKYINQHDLALAGDDALICKKWWVRLQGLVSFSVLFRRAYRKRRITFWTVSVWHFMKSDCKMSDVWNSMNLGLELNKFFMIRWELTLNAESRTVIVLHV